LRAITLDTVVDIAGCPPRTEVGAGYRT